MCNWRHSKAAVGRSCRCRSGRLHKAPESHRRSHRTGRPRARVGKCPGRRQARSHSTRNPCTGTGRRWSRPARRRGRPGMCQSWSSWCRWHRLPGCKPVRRDIASSWTCRTSRPRPARRSRPCRDRRSYLARSAGIRSNLRRRSSQTRSSVQLPYASHTRRRHSQGQRRIPSPRRMLDRPCADPCNGCLQTRRDSTATFEQPLGATTSAAWRNRAATRPSSRRDQPHAAQDSADR